MLITLRERERERDREREREREGEMGLSIDTLIILAIKNAFIIH